MPNDHPFSLKTGFDTERYRHQLLASGQHVELLKTYSPDYPEIPDQNSGKFWDQRFAEETTQLHHMEQDRNQQIANWLQRHAKNLRVLNLGAGSGLLEERLYPTHASEITWAGTDITVKTLRKLRKKYPAWKFQKQQLTKLRIKQDSYDVILLLEVLEHIKPQETHTVLAEVFRVLKPGGTFIISVPINEGLEDMFPTNPNSHLRVYSLPLLKWELEQAGFQLQRVQQLTAFATGYRWKSWLNSWLKLKHANNLIGWCRKPT